MSIGRGMGKEVALRIHDGILLNYKKECIGVSFNEVDEPRAYYTEWSKSERERQRLYINTYIWNLEWWYLQSCVQGSKGDTDVKNRLSDSVGEGEDGMMWEQHWNPCITLRKTADQQAWYITQGTQSRCSGTTHRDGMGREVGGRVRMGNICTVMADSCECMAKTTTIL